MTYPDSFSRLKRLAGRTRIQMAKQLSGRANVIILFAVGLISVVAGLVCYGDTYATWKTQVFTPADQANPAVSGEYANPTNDGIKNLQKYAFGLNPYQHLATGLPTSAAVDQNSNTYLTLTYQVPSADPPTDILYLAESSPDLQTWEYGPGITDLLSTQGPTNGLNFYTYISTALPLSTNIHSFMRVRIEETAIINLASGTYAGSQTATITGPTGATFYYTTDGSTPTNLSNIYSGAIPINYSQTLKVQAYLDGSPFGGVVVATYTISAPGIGLAIIAGNNQPGGSGVVLPQPLTVQVTNSSGAPVANASVTFNVTVGGGLIAQTGAGTPASSPITVSTNSQGDAYVYFTTANPVATTNTITATTGSVSTAFSEAPPEGSQLPNEGDNSQGGASAPPGVYGVTPVAGPVPFNAYTGNGSRVVDDLVSPAVGETGLGWKRYLHTRITDGESLFDFSGLWRHSYQWDFFFSGTQIEVVYPDGTTNTFAYDSVHSLYRSTISVDDIITNPSPGNYKLIRSNNQVYNFSSTTLNSNTIYYLSSIYDSKGNKTTLTWGNPVIINPNPNYFTLNSITEPGGNVINITYDLYAIHETSGTADTYGIMISQATTSDGRYVKYNYNDYAPVNGTGSIYQFLAGATYSPSTAPTLATYNFNSFLEISSAQDTRAEGAPDVNFLYYDADGGITNAETGTLLGIQDGSVANNAGQLYEANNITQNVNTAIVTYPDNSGNIFTAYTYTLDSQGNVLAVTNSDPHYNINVTDRFAYTANLSAGTVTTTSVDGNGHTITTVKTLGGQILSRTYPIVSPETVAPSESWHYTTDSNNFTYLSSYTDANTNETQYFYAANPVAGQPQLLSSISYPDGTSESFFYNTTLAQSTPPIIVVDHHVRRNGGTEYFTYYANGQLKTKQLASQTTGQFSTYVYETGTGRLHTITDANANVTTLGYDDRGQVTQAQYAQAGYVDIAHSTRFYGYDGDGRFDLFTDELGNKTGYNYDNLNRLTSAVVAPGTLNYTTTYSYDPNQPSNSSPTLIVSPTGKQESISYALIWGYKATSVTKKGVGGIDSATTINGYDAAGNLTSVEDPNLKTTIIGYDARNRKASVTDPALNLTQLFYDDNSNLTSVVSPEGTTVSHYDSLNRLKDSTDPKGQEVQMTYDAEGQLKTYTDPAKSLYQYTYDFDERRLTMKYPDLTSEVYQYDAIGNLYKFTTRDSKLQTFFYDARNRNNQYTWSDGTPNVNRTYYDNNTLHTLSNSSSAITYTYDGLNRIQGEAQNITGLGSESVGYAFNTDNTPNTLTYPDGTVLTYGYDGRNDVKSVTQSGVSTAVVGYGYDGNGNRTSKTWGNGVSSILNYDNVERLTSITDSFSTTTLESFNYGYDALSRAKYVKRSNGLGDVFSYDTSDQLTNVEYNATNPDTTPTNPSKTVAYTLDSSGNRKQVVDSIAGTTAYLPFNTSTPANSNNQYTTIGGNTVGYDNRYNLTSYNGTTYTYDAENHLTQLTNGTLTENFYYDPLGRCVATYNSSTSTTTYSVYDLGWNVLADYTAVNALPRMGTAAIAQRYVHGVGTDEIASKTALPANQVVYYQSDGAGNVTQLTNASGAVIEGYSYDVFGTPTFKNGTGGVISGTQYANRFLFAGREYLTGVNLYQYRHRVYSPDIGRFLQPDPIGHDGDGYNFYRFCGNDPVNNADPSGLDPGADFSFFEGGGSDFFSYGTSDSGTTFFSNYSPSFGSTGFSGGSGGSGGNLAIGGLTINQAPQSMVTGQAGMSPSSFGVLDGIQASLTVAGFVPGLGEVTNGASAIISLFQGDWEGAGLSAAALVPFAGDFADAAKLARLGKKGSGAIEGGTRTLYHYTDEKGLKGILEDEELKPSLKEVNPKDARYGNGQYVSDIIPGTKTPAQLSSTFLRNPFQGRRFTHFVEIDVTGLEVVEGRAGVFVIPGNTALDLTGRIVSHGAH